MDVDYYPDQKQKSSVLAVDDFDPVKQPQQHQQQQASMTIDPWQICYDEVSQSYYRYNPNTQESYWIESEANTEYHNENDVKEIEGKKAS